MMTFEEWQAEKTLVSREEVTPYYFQWDDGNDTKQCWLYPGELVIECRPGDRFLLVLERDQSESAEIEPLERRLYEFGVSEGFIS